ncbi:MAG TPA: hypothetical protein VK616_05355 [Flavitalea sp.]|nr:hypothetical protein [Flavitalea sp.]
MKPVNQSARSSAINKFFGFYAISLLAVILAAYFLFNTPAGIFKNEIQKYKSTEAEQSNLLNKIDRMTGNLKNIIHTDEKYLSSNNEFEKGSLLSNLQEYQKNINDALVNLKNDSSSFLSLVSKKDSYNYINVFNAIIAYRNTITSLQKILEGKGGDASELLRMKSQLDLCNQQLEICKMLAAKPAPAAPAPSGGGGGNNAKETELQRSLDKCQSDLAACQKKTGTIVPVSVEPAGNSKNEDKKSLVLFEAGQDLYTMAGKTKNLIERRGVLSAAKQLLQKSSIDFPDKDKLNKMINQIDAELKKLSNMG